MGTYREISESPLRQGKDEIIAYPISIPSSWGSSPTSPTFKIYLDGVDKSSDCLNGSGTVAGTVITTPLVKSLTSGKRYRLEVKWEDNGNTLEAFSWIDAED